MNDPALRSIRDTIHQTFDYLRTLDGRPEGEKVNVGYIQPGYVELEVGEGDSLRTYRVTITVEGD